MNDETIDEINRKDARFRFVVVLVTVFAILALATLLILAYQESLNNQKLINAQNKTLTTLVSTAKQRSTQIDDLQKHIDCIVELFKVQNRANLVISDIENCKIDQATTTTPNISSTVPNSTPSKPLALSTVSPTPQPTKPLTQPLTLPGKSGSHRPLVDSLSQTLHKICIPFTNFCL